MREAIPIKTDCAGWGFRVGRFKLKWVYGKVSDNVHSCVSISNGMRHSNDRQLLGRREGGILSQSCKDWGRRRDVKKRRMKMINGMRMSLERGKTLTHHWLQQTKLKNIKG